MPKFQVIISKETTYEVEAENEAEAEDIAEDQGTYIDSDVFNVTVEEVE